MTLVPVAHLRSVEAFEDDEWLEFLRREESHREEHRKSAEAAKERAEKLNPEAAARRRRVFQDGN